MRLQILNESELHKVYYIAIMTQHMKRMEVTKNDIFIKKIVFFNTLNFLKEIHNNLF